METTRTGGHVTSGVCLCVFVCVCVCVCVLSPLRCCMRWLIARFRCLLEYCWNMFMSWSFLMATWEPVREASGSLSKVLYKSWFIFVSQIDSLNFFFFFWIEGTDAHCWLKVTSAAAVKHTHMTGRLSTQAGNMNNKTKDKHCNQKFKKKKFCEPFRVTANLLLCLGLVACCIQINQDCLLQMFHCNSVLCWLEESENRREKTRSKKKKKKWRIYETCCIVSLPTESQF